MKGNKKLLVVAILLLLITVSFTTYAIYKTSVESNATVTAAKWDVAFKDGSTEITSEYTVAFSGADCVNNHVASGKIAPGATCSKTITLDASQAEVDVTYTATTGTVTYSGGTAIPNTANQFTATLSPASGNVAMGGSATLTLSVVWAGADNDENPNAADVTLAGQTINVPITLTAKQVPVSAS